MDFPVVGKEQWIFCLAKEGQTELSGNDTLCCTVRVTALPSRESAN